MNFENLLSFLFHSNTTDGWNKFSHPYTKMEFGKWELILPPKYDKTAAVDHNTKLKVESNTSSYLFIHAFFFFAAIGKV